MSARRRPGEYPDLLARDAVFGGVVRLWRNPADKPFAKADVWTLEAGWKLPADIPAAYAEVERLEAELAAKHALAWDSDFGYLSPEPLHCGTGLGIEGEFHLEALHLIGDLPPVLAALEAVRLQSANIVEDGIRQAAHLFRIRNAATLGIAERALVKRTCRVFEDLVTQELNARKSLVEDTPRILEDSVARALAVLRSARLLAPGELLDLLSPIRLAVTMGLLSGITRAETLKLMREQIDAPELPPPRTAEDDRRRDARDAGLADWANVRFADVTFNARAEELFG